jgi:hypothetical protein
MHKTAFSTMGQARLEIFRWLTYCNARRRHSALAYLCPRRTPRGVITRVMQRILALTAAIWHNDRTGGHPPHHRNSVAGSTHGPTDGTRNDRVMGCPPPS